MLAFTNYLRTPETRVGSQTNAITLSQQFPWFGTLGMREQVAAKEASRYRQQYEAAKDQAVQQVKTAYYRLAFIDLALDINDEERLLLDHYEKLAEARYRQGAGLQQAVVKLQAEITRVQSRLEELKSRRVDAEASLNSLMNRPAETPVPRIKLPPVPPVDIDYKQLYQVGRQNRPEVLASLLEIERDEKRIDLARNRHKPLSILRAEGKRTLEQFYDQEGTALTRSDRDRLIEDILAESVGFGPLEEAFRDDAVKEILVLNGTTILGRKADAWMPLSGRFRDDDQLRTVLARWADAGEATSPGPRVPAASTSAWPTGFGPWPRSRRRPDSR